MSSVNKGTEISFSPLGLQTILFALSGSGSFIFALGGIEFIGYLEAEALEIPVNPIFHIASMPYKYKMENIPVPKNNHWSVNVMVSVSFKKGFGKACIDLSFRARYKKSLPGSGGEISFHIEEPAFGKVEVVVQTDIETGLVPVFGDSYFIRIHVQKKPYSH